jgi:hypothetical protein
MDRIDLEALAAAIQRPAGGVELAPGARLTIPAEPSPFVPPQLIAESSRGPFAAEVIIVSSAAAVGKSTVARYLAATAEVPLLDLAQTHVSTNSLVGLLATDVVRPQDPTGALQRSQLSVLIDALDEGRLLSGDANFEEFLRTSWELLLRDRTKTVIPKIVLFGRDLAAELVQTTLDVYGEGITVSSLTLDFFDHEEAVEVVEAHAAASAQLGGRSWTSSLPVGETISTFFTAIESALALDGGTLWSDPQGRAFAGYAPVLAAIGTLLASESNPTRLKNALERSGATRAWEVIERVAEAILERERDEKVAPQFARAASGPPSSELYDADEQLTYLIQIAQQQPLRPTRRVSLTGQDAETYQRMLEQHVPEHPFLQEGRLANDVLASIVLAHAVTNDLLADAGLAVLRDASRLPFLWRSLHRLLEREGPAFIDGRYVGCILNSLWNDAIAGAARVTARSSDEQAEIAVIEVEAGSEQWTLEAIHPIEFYEQVRDIDARLGGDVVLQGPYGQQQSPSFDVRGNVILIVSAGLDIRTAGIRIDGDLGLSATTVTQPANLQIAVTPRSHLWWGSRVRDLHPWSQHAVSLEPPIEEGPVGPLERLLTRCAERLPPGSPLTFTRDYYPAEDRRLAWVEREFSSDEFSLLIRLLVEHGLANAQSAPASGPTPMVRIHFSATWDRLLQALRTPQLVDPQLAEAVDAVQRDYQQRLPAPARA